MKPLALTLAVLLASCATGPHPLPATAQSHIASAWTLPDGELAIGCTKEKPCYFASGVWYPTELAAHMVGAEVCCKDCIQELRKADRAGVDSLAIAITAIGAGIVTGLAVAAGYELKEWLKK